MFSNYLAAALRNLARNRLYAAISIVGLAVGMAAAILTGLYIRDELTFDHFIPGHDRIFTVVSTFQLGDRAPQRVAYAPDQVASWLKLDFPAVEAVARAMGGSVSVRRGEQEVSEDILWVDPDFLEIMAYPAVAGDPAAALGRPDAVVLTRRVARKYFGKDAPLGELLQFNRDASLRVAAVIEDLPGNSTLKSGIFASGLAANSPLAQADARPPPPGAFLVSSRTFVRLKEASDAEAMNQAMPGFVSRHMPQPTPPAGIRRPRTSRAFTLVPIGALHLYPLTTGPSGREAQGSPTVLFALGGMALLILIVAGVNFVNLMTARAARRAVEVGVRKAAGAGRRDIVLQFLGESLVYAAMAMLLAMALAELTLPALSALLARDLRFSYWADPETVAGLAGLTIGVGLLAGIYPAFVLSAFRPAAVLKGGVPALDGSATVRASLVVMQFAVLIALILATVVTYRQTRFLLNDAVKVDHDQVLTVTTRCRGAFLDQVRTLPGVRAATCSSAYALDQGMLADLVPKPDGSFVTLAMTGVDFGFFELYGVRPLAGRLFSRDHPGDLTPPPPDRRGAPGPPAPPLSSPKVVVVNQAAVRALGLGTPDQAIGKMVRRSNGPPAEVIGVVPNIAFDTTRGPVNPTAYLADPSSSRLAHIKLVGRDIPETLAAIDTLWKQLGEPRPINRRFVDEYLQTVYAETIRQAVLIAALAGVAVFIAVLGLFGLAAFTAERRTKEIGVRKAMGADRADVLKLLLWQFTQPVLWACLIAWPLGWLAMNHWLQGFAYRVALEPWLFVAAAAAALVIAWATVITHALKVSREKPVAALRYE